MFRFLILGMLRPGVRQHGYALVKAYRERSGVDVSTGNFYRELQRLVLDGLIRGADNPPEADARRTPYEITPLGMTVFDEWLTAADAGAGGCAEDELSARILFADETDAATMLRVLDRLQENVWFFGKSLERARRQAPASCRCCSRGA
jgi:DNA-binding PadR family transcriptional regulator